MFNGASSLITSSVATALNTTVPAVPTPSHLRVALSGISSSTSLACWIVLLLPQLIEQWKLKSSEGISIGFISIWFLGDAANLVGSVWAGLLPGVILLAVWFCVADGLLIGSYLYYRNAPTPNGHAHHHQRKHSSGTATAAGPAAGAEASESANDETQPLLNGSAAPPRRKSSHRRRRDSLASIMTIPATTSSSVFTQYVLPVLFVISAGVVGYLFSSDNGDQTPPSDDDGAISGGPQFLGYLSAILYLGARLPQIYQNHQKRSVYGLSLLFFLFSMLGNLTYSGGILFYRSDSRYVMKYMPWLLGSLGTIFEDVAIILQFFIYNRAGATHDSAIAE